MGRFLARFVVAGLLLIIGPAAFAQSGETPTVLLIGAAAYDDQNIRDLRGPMNDVEGMYRAMRALNVSRDRIQVLSDPNPQAGAIAGADYSAARRGRATLANIRAAFANLAADARPGGKILIYYSGHGLQVGDRAEPGGGREADGLDEALAPVDIAATPDGYANVLLDDELGILLRRLAERGADVWVILDACHSGTALRAPISDRPSVSAEARLLPMRGAVVSLAPDDEPAFEQGDAIETAATGRVAVISAVQANQKAYEDRFPRGNSEALVWGEMTFAILRSLRAGETPTMRRLARQVRASYGWSTARMPLIQGAVDLPFFGAREERRVFDVRVDSGALTVDAGALDGMSRGDLLTILSGAGRAVLGEARVENVGLASSTLTWVGAPARLAGVIVAAPSARNLTFERTLGAEPGSRAALEPFFSSGSANQLLNIDLHAPDPDIVLRASNGRVFFDAPGGASEMSPSLPMAGLTQDRLLRAAQRVASVGNLLTAAEAYAQTSSSMTVRFARSPGDSRAGVCVLPPRDALAGYWRAASERGERVDSAADVMRVRNCDIVTVALENNSGQSVDLTALYVERSGYIGPLQTDPREVFNGASRIAPGERRVFGFIEQASYAASRGVKHLVLVFAPSSAAGPLISYDYLAQKAVDEDGDDAAMPTVRSGVAAPLDRLFRAGRASQDGLTRGVAPVARESNGAFTTILRFEVE